jgi:DNA-binding transcriptional ArsR family regulator
VGRARAVTSGVRATSGAGYELLVGLVAVADERWRSVLTGGDDLYRAARVAGKDLTRDAARLGRLGWVNLLPLLPGTDGSRAALLDAVSGLDAGELHRVVLGARRVEPPARSDLTSWLRRTVPAEVRETCLQVIRAMPEPAVVPPPATALDGRPHEVLERVAPGVRYDEVAGALVLVACAAVHPVIVVVHETNGTVVAHPPEADGGPTDAGSRLRLLARAAGDQTRMRVLQELRGGSRTLPDLCRALDSPRTTLLHHLALLRGAGLIDVAVSEPDPNVYTLREAGFDDLAQAARAFTIR